MNKTKMNIRTYSALCLSCLLLTTASASAQSKQEIVHAWQQQIESFHTLQLDYEVSVFDLMDPFGADALSTLKYKFALSGDKYYSYVKFSSGKDFSAMASAYNGDYYQKLMDEKDKITVYKSKKEDRSEQPYLGGQPLTIQYDFAFMPDEPHTIETLQKPETWERLVKRITEIRPSTRYGRSGFTVDIEIPQNRKTYKIFVDEKTLWPYHFSYVSRLSQDEMKVNEEVGEMDVNAVTSVDEENVALKFPSQIILRALRNGRLIMQGHINTVPKSLKINEPVPDDIFTIAPQDATFVDADERERIFQEAQNYAKSHPVGLAQPTVKVGDSAPNFSLADSSGKNWNLAKLRGQQAVVLTFFPKCFTGNCANQLAALRDYQADFDKNDVQIIAVSVDPAEGEKGQKAFAQQWKLIFPMIPDTQRVLSKLYGAVQADNERAARMTVLIDKAGIVRDVDTNVYVKTHGSDVLAKLRELKIIK